MAVKDFDQIVDKSPRDRRYRMKRSGTTRKTENLVYYEVYPANPPPLTAEQKEELRRLAAMPDSEIDTSDIPPLEFTSGVVVRDPFVRPPLKSKVKEFLVDSDIIYWVINQAGDGYQDKLNAMLRRAMEEERAAVAKE